MWIVIDTNVLFKARRVTENWISSFSMQRACSWPFSASSADYATFAGFAALLVVASRGVKLGGTVAMRHVTGDKTSCHVSLVTSQVVSAKLSARAALAASRASPENVNYAINPDTSGLSFLESVPEVSAKLKEPNTKERKFEDVVEDAEQAAVLVLVY
jgi:hypothetical protein